MKQREDLDHTYIGTCFDRQVRIQLWNQKLIQSQTALILGVGGLGSALLINLLRLGLKKIIIVDYDEVDIHNLNRQLMYCKEDVGKRKVASAIKNSSFHNINNTIIQGFDGNALTNWQQMVKFAQQSQIIFNCIDYGQFFDIAVASLCLKLKIPLIMGGTYATTLTVDYFNSEGKPCYLCSDDHFQNKQQINQITPDKILQLSDITFLPKNNNPVGRSSVVVCTLCGQMMVSHYLNQLFLSQVKPYPSSRLICYHNNFEIIKFDVAKQNKCLFCGDPNYVQPPKPQQTKDNQADNQPQSNLKIQLQPNNTVNIESTTKQQEKI